MYVYSNLDFCTKFNENNKTNIWGISISSREQLSCPMITPLAQNHPNETTVSAYPDMPKARIWDPPIFGPLIDLGFDLNVLSYSYRASTPIPITFGAIPEQKKIPVAYLQYWRKVDKVLKASIK